MAGSPSDAYFVNLSMESHRHNTGEARRPLSSSSMVDRDVHRHVESELSRALVLELEMALEWPWRGYTGHSSVGTDSENVTICLPEDILMGTDNLVEVKE